jgi:hypothetical protein
MLHRLFARFASRFRSLSKSTQNRFTAGKAEREFIRFTLQIFIQSANSSFKQEYQIASREKCKGRRARESQRAENRNLQRNRAVAENIFLSFVLNYTGRPLQKPLTTKVSCDQVHELKCLPLTAFDSSQHIVTQPSD